MADPLPQRFADAMGQALGPMFPEDIGVAVSGGGDSMAMLHLAAGWARVFGVRLWPVTVDHGLRREARGEIAMVARDCRTLGLPHAVLRWDWDGSGNLQDAARRGRLALLDRWRGDVAHVLMGHTQDDQAETVLMRLARGSGAEGLAGMRAVRTVRQTADLAAPVAPGPGVPPTTPARRRDWRIVRPLLGVERAELRHHLGVLGIAHADDPTNDDPRFDRVRVRSLRPALDDIGLTAERLSATARRMARAQAALAARARDVAGRVAKVTPYDIAFDRDRFAEIEADTQLRLLAAALQFVAARPYRPRAQPLERALDAMLAGAGSTLHGGRIVLAGARAWVIREAAALRDGAVPAGRKRLWDARFRIEGPEIAGGSVRTLGEDGLAQIGDNPAAAVPRAALLVSPALFAGDRLVACPRLRIGADHGERFEGRSFDELIGPGIAD